MGYVKEELETKYMPSSFSARLIDNWHHHTQDNKSANEYVEKFDKFLIRCSTLHKEGEAQIFSTFRAGLRDHLWTELLVRGVNELEATYTLVQDLDSVRTNHTFKSHDYRASCLDIPHLPNPIGLVPNPFHIGMTLRARVLNGTIKIRASNFLKLVSHLSATNANVIDT